MRAKIANTLRRLAKKTAANFDVQVAPNEKEKHLVIWKEGKVVVRP